MDLRSAFGIKKRNWINKTFFALEILPLRPPSIFDVSNPRPYISLTHFSCAPSLRSWHKPRTHSRYDDVNVARIKETHECTYCGRTVTTKDSLKRHIRTHFKVSEPRTKNPTWTRTCIRSSEIPEAPSRERPLCMRALFKRFKPELFYSDDVLSLELVNFWLPNILLHC